MVSWRQIPVGSNLSTNTGGGRNSTMYLWVGSIHCYRWPTTKQCFSQLLSITCKQGFYGIAYWVQTVSLMLNFIIVPPKWKNILMGLLTPYHYPKSVSMKNAIDSSPFLRGNHLSVSYDRMGCSFIRHSAFNDLIRTWKLVLQIIFVE